MMYEHIKRLYLGKVIGLMKVIHAYNNGWITKEQLDTLINTKVNYSLDEAVKFALELFSYQCEKNIHAGIDIRLSDGDTHHFSLSKNDQTNLNAKMLNIMAGITELEYHSDGEPCKYYNVADMTTICMAAQAKVTAETTYYNCLSQWVRNCKTADEVMAISYGVDIPEEYQSEPWKDIVKKMNGAFDVQENDNISDYSNKDDVEQTENTIEEENNIEESVEE